MYDVRFEERDFDIEGLELEIIKDINFEVVNPKSWLKFSLFTSGTNIL